MSELLKYIDLTSLSGDDTTESIEKLCRQAVEKKVAAVCVFPTFIKTCKEHLPSDFPIATVVGGFPHGQVPLAIKELETTLAIDLGATEIDMVISRSFLLEKKLDLLQKEISSLASICHEHGAKLKTIIEVGELKTNENIALASKIALESGSDFIKTSTGKAKSNATLEAARVMVNCLKDHYSTTGKLAGFKPAGGIKTPEDAKAYLDLMIQAFGHEQIGAHHFRIGASSLVDAL